MSIFQFPEDIRALKPKGTMVKAIQEWVTMYTCTNLKGEDGRVAPQDGKCLYQRHQEVGFIPNDNFCTEEKISVVSMASMRLPI